MRGPASILLALSISAMPVTAQTVLPRVAPERAGLDPAGTEAITSMLEDYVARRQIPGAVAAIARNGQIGYLATVGVQDLGTRAPMDERTIFRIYSMSKTVTATAAMMLWEEGAFDLDDPVADYLPEFDRVMVDDDGTLRRPSRPISVRDLLLHTAGLSHRTSELYRAGDVRNRADSLPQFIDKITSMPLMDDPGARYRYSESPTVVGRLVEIWANEPLDEFMERRIFGPLGMVDTGFWVHPGARGRLAGIYGPGERGGLQPVQIEEIDFTDPDALHEGAVGLVSTVPDVLRFSQMLLNGGELGDVRLLRAQTVRMMTENGLSPEVTELRGGTSGWGLGNVSVVLEEGAGGEPSHPGEYGWNGSAGTIFYVDPNRDVVAVLMTQTSPYFPDGLRTRFKTLLEASIIP